MEFLEKFIAQLLSKFKTASPVAFVVVAALLTAVKFLIDNGTIPIDPKISEWILWVIALVTGSHTSAILAKTNNNE